MKRYGFGISCAAVLVLAAFTPAANAQEKELTTVSPSATIEKSCGQLFAVTTFGDKANGPTFLFYRTNGSDKNTVVPAAHAVVEISNIARPVVTVDNATLVHTLRMSLATWQEAKECLPVPIGAPQALAR